MLETIVAQVGYKDCGTLSQLFFLILEKYANAFYLIVAVFLVIALSACLIHNVPKILSDNLYWRYKSEPSKTSSCLCNSWLVSDFLLDKQCK